jgi:hypothetical protein
MLEANGMDIREEFLSLVDVLNGSSVEYAVCGGIALLFHGVPRLTIDIDILVREQDVTEVKRLVASI